MKTILTIAAASVIMATASLGMQSAMAKQGDSGSYGAGYKHGCDDSKLPMSARHIVQPGKGSAFHSE
jgi:hypothetical protein